VFESALARFADALPFFPFFCSGCFDSRAVVALFLLYALSVIGASVALFFFIVSEAEGAFVAAVVRVIFGLVVAVLFLRSVAVSFFTCDRTSSLGSGHVSSQYFRGTKGQKGGTS
jgi:hypothetical protein